MTIEVRLSTEQVVRVRPFLWSDRDRLAEAFARIFDGGSETVAALERGDAAFLVRACPDVIERLLQIATASAPEEISRWTLGDAVAVSCAVWEVNRADTVLPVLRGFFGRIARVAAASPPNPGPGSA